MKYKFLLVFILFLSFFVRLLGVDFNLPYIEFTDELTVGRDVSYIAQTGDFKSYHFFYPPLHTYFQSLVILFYSKLKGIPVGAVSQNELYLLLRTTVAILGGVSVYLVYKIAEKTTREKLPALFAAAIFGFNLTHVAYSQLVKNEIPALFLGLVTTLLALKILEEGRPKWYLLSGFFCGLTFATAYPGVLFAVPILVSHLVFECRTRKLSFSLLFSRKLFLGAFGLFLGFAIGDPAFILDQKLFLAKIRFSRQYIETHYSQPLSLSAWRWYLDYLWRFGLYPPVFLLVVGGTILAVKKYLIPSVVSLSFIVGYGLVIFLNNNYYTDRLSLPLIPFLTIFAGVCLAYLYNLFLTSLKNHRPLARAMAASLLVLFFSLLFLRVGLVSYQMAQPSPLRAVEDWFDENVTADTRIFLTATGGKLAFSPNTLEKKYRLIYYYPEIISRSPEALSLLGDYALLYWAGNLPKDWVEDLTTEFRLLKEFPAPRLPKKLGFLKAYATIANPFMVARSGFQPAAIYALPSRPADNYGIITEVRPQGRSLEGKFTFVPGTEGGRTKFIYSTDFVLTSESGSQKMVETFKNFNDAREYKFNLAVDEKAIEFDRPIRDARIDGELVKSLYKRLNLGVGLEGEILGQDGKDYCGWGGQCRPSGVIDSHLRIVGVEKKIRRLAVFSGEEAWMSPFNGAYPDAYLKRRREIVDLYFEPSGTIGEKTLRTIIYYQDGTVSLLEI